MSERLQTSYIILCAILSNKFIVNFHKTTLDYAWLARHVGYTAVQVCWLDSNLMSVEAQHGFSQTTSLVPQALVGGRAWELP